MTPMAPLRDAQRSLFAAAVGRLLQSAAAKARAQFHPRHPRGAALRQRAHVDSQCSVLAMRWARDRLETERAGCGGCGRAGGGGGRDPQRHSAALDPRKGGRDVSRHARCCPPASPLLARALARFARHQCRCTRTPTETRPAAVAAWYSGGTVRWPWWAKRADAARMDRAACLPHCSRLSLSSPALVAWREHRGQQLQQRRHPSKRCKLSRLSQASAATSTRAESNRPVPAHGWRQRAAGRGRSGEGG